MKLMNLHFPAEIWPVVFSLPVPSHLFLHSLYASTFPELDQRLAFKIFTQDQAFLHWLPSHVVPLTVRRYTLPCVIYTPSHSILLLAAFPQMKDLCCASCVSALSNLEPFWGLSIPHFPYYKNEISFLMSYGEQGSHSSLELFHTGLFQSQTGNVIISNLWFYFFSFKKNSSQPVSPFRSSTLKIF